MVSKAKRRGHWTDLFRDYELKADVRLVDHEAPRVLRQILGQMLREAWGQCTPTRLPKGAPGVPGCCFRKRRLESFPVVEVEIAEGQERLQAAAGLTVGEVRASYQVPADWQGNLDDQPVADTCPILPRLPSRLSGQHRRNDGRRVQNDPLTGLLPATPGPA